MEKEVGHAVKLQPQELMTRQENVSKTFFFIPFPLSSEREKQDLFIVLPYFWLGTHSWKEKISRQLDMRRQPSGNNPHLRRWTSFTHKAHPKNEGRHNHHHQVLLQRGTEKEDLLIQVATGCAGVGCQLHEHLPQPG